MAVTDLSRHYLPSISLSFSSILLLIRYFVAHWFYTTAVVSIASLQTFVFLMLWFSCFANVKRMIDVAESDSQAPDAAHVHHHPQPHPVSSNLVQATQFDMQYHPVASDPILAQQPTPPQFGVSRSDSNNSKLPAPLPAMPLVPTVMDDDSIAGSDNYEETHSRGLETDWLLDCFIVFVFVHKEMDLWSPSISQSQIEGVFRFIVIPTIGHHKHAITCARTQNCTWTHNTQKKRKQRIPGSSKV